MALCHRRGRHRQTGIRQQAPSRQRQADPRRGTVPPCLPDRTQAGVRLLRPQPVHPRTPRSKASSAAVGDVGGERRAPLPHRPHRLKHSSRRCPQPQRRCAMRQPRTFQRARPPARKARQARQARQARRGARAGRAASGVASRAGRCRGRCWVRSRRLYKASGVRRTRVPGCPPACLSRPPTVRDLNPPLSPRRALLCRDQQAESRAEQPDALRRKTHRPDPRICARRSRISMPRSISAPTIVAC